MAKYNPIWPNQARCDENKKIDGDERTKMRLCVCCADCSKALLAAERRLHLSN